MSAGGTPKKSRLREWLADRIGLEALGETIRAGQVPGGASLWHTLGSVAAGLFVLEAVTGVFLATAYTPSATGAWASVAFIQDQLTLGWFVRGLHSFGSSALIVVAGLHLLQVFLFGAYRRPRELNWMVGLVMFGVVAVFALSGYLLPWDQKGYWAKVVEATITGSAPVVGPSAQRMIQGGATFGTLTLTRAYALHAMALPAVLTGLLAFHIYLFRRHGYTPKWSLSTEEAAARAVPTWPDQAFRNAVVGLLAWGVVAVAVIARHGAPLESPADPASSYLARPEWYALPLFQLRMFFEGPLEIVATMVIPGIVTALAFALPFLDRGASNRPGDRRRVLAAATLGLAAVTALGVTALAKDARDPAYAKARADEKLRGEVARQLALKGVHPDGNVFRNDPMFHAREIWDERCAGCHGLAGMGGEKGPDLKDYNSRAWIRGFLANPDGPLYMGPAKIEKGMRAVDATAEEQEALVEFLYAETGAADADTAKAARGKDLLSPKDCDTCHDIDGEGENDGPNLKGRGTAKWVAAVIADAGHPLLFTDRNKMPKFSNKLTPAEIEDMTKFVLGLKGR
ncbi:MAG TPA: cytochrome b N-terminal domain-containing protein [Polyangia bacterium]|jgi:ubiquinol-cytochrome c reductase cytochrome b subunit|nr:cytochrome b N-terminal domain-containing protein [Polyangia bacterium]